MKRPHVFLFLVLCIALIITNAFAAKQKDSFRLYVQHQLEMARALQNSLNKADSSPLLAKVNAQNGGSIAGTVYGLVDADGSIKSAIVEAFTDSVSKGDSTSFKTMTYVNEDGSYQLTNLPPGRYVVFAWADGYSAKYFDDVTDFSLAKRIPVGEGDEIGGIDFRMEKIPSGTGSISGIVTQENTGEPMENAYVNVFSSDPYYYHYGWAATNRDGTFQITGLPGGNYYATAWAEGFIGEYYDNAESFADADLITVADETETKDVNFSLSKGATISGTVLDKEGQPLQGVFIEAITSFQDSVIKDDGTVGSGYYGYSSAVSDEKGNYTIAGLPTGTFYIHATYWNSWNYWFWVEKWYNNADTFSDATPLDVKAGDDIMEIDFVLSFEIPGGSISGVVTDLEGQPVANATVQATTFLADGMLRPSYYGSAITDKDGKYQITYLPDDQYIVSVWSQVGWQYVFLYWPGVQNYEEAKPVVVAGGAATGIDFQLPITIGTASITGTVAAADGKPLAWAYVQISPAELTANDGQIKAEIWAYATTDSFGAYKVGQLPEGKYMAYASYWQDLNFGQEWYDNAATREEATIIELANKEQRENIDFSLNVKPIYGSVAGIVRNKATGEPISRAYVELTPFYGAAERLFAPFWYNNFYAITDENGSFTFEMVYEGQYLVSAYAKGGFAYYKDAVVAQEATPVTVIGGEKTVADFSLSIRQDGSGKITGTVSDDYGNPFEIAVVTARPTTTILSFPESEMFYTTVTEKDGLYELTGLPAGEYFLMSFAPFAVAEYYDNAYDPSEATVIKVAESGTVSGINFNLSQIWLFDAGMDGNKGGNNGGARVIGKVTNENGSSLEGAGVYVMKENGQRLAYGRTQNDGSYEIAGIAPGSYIMQAGKIGYEGAFNGNVQEFSAAEAMQLGNGTTQIDFVLAAQKTDVDDNNSLPKTVQLLGNYPNPFNPATAIIFELPAKKHVAIKVYNIAGALVAELADRSFDAGRHNVFWNGLNANNQPVTSGLYFYEFKTDGLLKTGKMILLR